jgi:catechol 2,3-dioxygenase-like lactoylglutathione lyase family enzyme
MVSDLNRSVQFYSDVCGLQEIVREPESALLGADDRSSMTLDLRQQDRGLRSGQQTLGLRACSFRVGSKAELDRVEERLKALSAFQDRYQFGGDDGVHAVRAHDPDRLPLAFMSYQSPLTAAAYQRMGSLMYSWDV